MSCFCCDYNIVTGYRTINDGRIDICNDCMNLLNGSFSCSRCSNLITINRENRHIMGYFKDGKIYCSSCAPIYGISGITNFTHKRGNLNGYCYKPNPIFHPTTLRSNSNLFLGVELEMGLARSNQAVGNFCDNHDGKIFYFKTDCSIRSYGCEVVTHPCTIDYHKSEESGWKQLLEDAESAGFRSGSEANTGIHVHMNRNFFTDKDLKKIDLFVNFYRDLWEKIAGRRNNSYCSYSMKRHNEWGHNNNGRYSSVNYCNSHTIELRIFNGNIKYNDVMAILEICHALAIFCKDITFEELYEKSNDVKSKFKNLLYDRSKYQYAKNFCNNNNIFEGV